MLCCDQYYPSPEWEQRIHIVQGFFQVTGSNTTTYYLNNVAKDANGNTIMVNYSGGVYPLAAVHTNRAMAVKSGSVIPCN